MRKLSITLLLIALSFITMEANILSTHKSKILVFKGWSERQKSVVFIPIEAVLEGHNIEVQFFEKPNEPVTFQVKDKKFYLQAGVPEGSNATIGIPKLRKYKVIKINDRLVWSHGKYVDNGIVSEGIVTDRYITFSCPAGIYSFIAE